MKKILSFLIALLLVAAAGVWYLGGFEDVQVQEAQTGPYYLIYVSHTGDYSQVGPIMDEIYMDVLDNGWTVGSGIGLYYDDPKTVAADELRSNLGMLVQIEDFAKIGDLSGDYKTMMLADTTRVLVKFPLKHKLSMMVGVFKAYPAINKYLSEHSYPSISPRIELYDDKEIWYLADIQ